MAGLEARHRQAHLAIAFWVESALWHLSQPQHSFTFVQRMRLQQIAAIAKAGVCKMSSLQGYELDASADLSLNVNPKQAAECGQQHMQHVVHWRCHGCICSAPEIQCGNFFCRMRRRKQQAGQCSLHCIQRLRHIGHLLMCFTKSALRLLCLVSHRTSLITLHITINS